jgi:hypothetical protein
VLDSNDPFERSKSVRADLPSLVSKNWKLNGTGDAVAQWFFLLCRSWALSSNHEQTVGGL